ncbi:MAG TPA: HAD family hydrolase [Bacteroidales bacterium]|jgi:putative hydrolase of the HAD superfamily|nr:HAD family hydrolase [Bacteroidales bacterium]MDI9573454.1 HAD family hydrolase [Bacteroidota bacterium]OQC61885.1 MAG: Pyrimidine 5'-nucleotidase YjjG [Bacteroidetes bacterium ADurb.Bin012]MBP9511257.1 HAD family hydrolase [Bacteroidales bacterium]MBP9587678.1 HAD family hydrolase [Bacteroidales bacterium]
MNPIHNIKAILFDFGGTLDTDGVHWSEKFWEAYTSAGIPVDKSEYEKAFIEAGDHLVSVIIQPHFGFKDTLAAQIELQLRYLESNHNLPPVEHYKYKNAILEYSYKEASKTLEKSNQIISKLAQDYLLGVVSNFYGNMDTVLKEFHLIEYFQIVIDSARVGVRKPSPDIFRLAIHQLRVPAGNTVVVGDSYDRDIVPAKQCGCITVWLEGRSWKKEEGGKQADYAIHSLKELDTLIHNITL